MTAPLSSFHGFALFNTPDFYISMQRQAINWPKYDKTGYSYKANTGWWLYAPMVAVPASGAALALATRTMMVPS